jgi:two-component system chemotaxis response regulator CheY
MRALVVDDSRAMRMILRGMLGELGFDEVVEAEHGQAALEHLEGGTCDVALVDWNMPVLDGLGFVRAVRTSRAHDRMKVLMVTSESGPRQVYEALKAGADEYAMKPVTREVIEGKLELLGFSFQAA